MIMKRNFRKIFLTSLALLSIGLMTTGVALSQNNIHVEVAYASVISEYYSSISSGMEGTTLRNALHNLNVAKKKKDVTYAGMRQFAAKSDADPDGSGKIIGFYDNKLVGPDWDSGKTWNREHVWPNIRGGSKVEDDAHMVRPASTQTNSDRGSKGYGEDSYDPGKSVEYYRGSAARIILYAAIADTSLEVVDYPFNYHGVGGDNSGYPVESMGSLSEMLKWNLLYQPHDTSFTGADDVARRTELNRNEVIYSDKDGQGNRNPFIDHPEYACRIWGNTNDATRAACKVKEVIPAEGGEIPPVDPDEGKITSLSINKTELSLKPGEVFQLYPEYQPANAYKLEFVWSSSDPSVASVDVGTVTAHKAGKTTISVLDTETNKAANCEVTVVSPGGCGGNITTTSIVLAAISAIGIGLILLRKKEATE